MSLNIKIIPGELPEFWDRGAVFFANLHSLFYGNAEQTKVLKKEIHGVPTYGGRLLPILNLLFRKGDNLIFLEAAPDQVMVDYLTGGLGLTLPEMKILSHHEYTSLKERIANNKLEAKEPIISRVREHSAPWVDAYATDFAITAIAERAGKSTLSSLEGSKRGNNKFLLHHHLVEKGFPVFDTEVASNPEKVSACLRELQKKGYKKAVLKSQIGASGCGLIKAGTGDSESGKFPEYLFFEGPCLVQGWLDEEMDGVRSIGSPSVQMFLSDTDLTLFDITEQFLKDDSVHEGNVSPPPYLKKTPAIQEELLFQAGVAGQWLHAQGYRGTASADYLVIEKKGETKIITCEINARVTGATYPAVLARYFLPHGAWLMRNLMFHPSQKGSGLLSELDKKNLLFKKGMKKGVLPCNLNLDAAGKVNKGQFVFIAPDPQGCEDILTLMHDAFPRLYSYDRD